FALRGAAADARGEVHLLLQEFVVVAGPGAEASRDGMQVGPAWIEAGVDDPSVVSRLRGEVQQDGEGPETREQGLGLRCVEQRLQRVALPLPTTGMHEQRVDVVIAEHAASSDGAPEAQRREAIGAAIDEVPEEVELVSRGVEANRAEQVFELARAALHVTDDPAHGSGYREGPRRRASFRGARRLRCRAPYRRRRGACRRRERSLVRRALDAPSRVRAPARSHGARGDRRRNHRAGGGESKSPLRRPAPGRPAPPWTRALRTLARLRTSLTLLQRRSGEPHRVRRRRRIARLSLAASAGLPNRVL